MNEQGKALRHEKFTISFQLKLDQTDLSWLSNPDGTVDTDAKVILVIRVQIIVQITKYIAYRYSSSQTLRQGQKVEPRARNRERQRV